MLPIIETLDFITTGFQFLTVELSRLQLVNFQMLGTALVLQSTFNLSAISRLWLKKKSVNAFSHFLSHAKIRFKEVTSAYHKMLQEEYADKLKGGSFIIDDTMEHHSKLCKFIHGVFTHFDHAIGTNLKAKCLVFLYYKEPLTIKFPIGCRIYYRGGEKNKYQLALELIEEALKAGFCCKTVLADSWYCVNGFIVGLKAIERELNLPSPLIYVMEIKSNLTVEVPLTANELKSKKRKKLYRTMHFDDYFKEFINENKYVGFKVDLESGKPEKSLYEFKRTVIKIHAFAGKHVLIRSYDLERETVKYLITNELTWEGVKILTEYSHRWVIEEFFRNAKQLLNIEGACIRSEQGVTLALFLVTLLDALFHLEIVRRTSLNSQTEPVTVQSIQRLAQLENIQNLIKIIRDNDRRDEFLKHWVNQLEDDAIRYRRKRYELVELSLGEFKLAA